MIEIESPYLNEIKTFNNGDSFPNLELVVPGMVYTLHLHRKTLARASPKLSDILNDSPGDKLEWMYEAKSEIDKQALVKALRFCYGETLKVGTKDGECCAVIAALSRLQVTYLDTVIPKLCDFALEQARKDLSVGIVLLKTCTHYEECCNTDTRELDKKLAKIILTKENLLEHFREVALDCLMALPSKYLDEVEYGEPHTKCGEFYLRIKYVGCHSKELTKKEQQAMMVKCDWSTLNSQELKELRLANIIDKDELLEAYEKALECSEVEKEKETQRVNQALQKVEQIKGEMIETNCL